MIQMKRIKMQSKITRNLSYVMSSNIIVMALGLIIMLFLPRFIGSVEDYGYWQIYYYYSAFFGLFLFGLNDGFNLLLAGTKFKSLDKKGLSVVLLLIILLTSLFSIILIIAFLAFIPDHEYKFIFSATALTILLLNISGFSMHVNQVSLRFKQYSILSSLERVLFVGLFLPLIFFGLEGFQVYVMVNLGVRLLVATYGIYSVRKVINLSEFNLRALASEKHTILKFIGVGWPLTYGTICATLISTSSRIIVERTMSVYEYGLFSLAFSFSLVVGLFTATLPAVLYPTLKIIAAEMRERVFNSLHLLIIAAGTLAMSLSFTIPTFLELFLPDYKPIASYVSYLFPWIIYQLVSLAILDVFYRLSRLEKQLFRNYFIGLIGIFLVQYWAISTYHDIAIMLVSGLVFYAIWTHICGVYLVLRNKWKLRAVQFIDVPFVVLFISVNVWNNSLSGLSLYLATWLILSVFTYFLCSNEVKYIAKKMFTRAK